MRRFYTTREIAELFSQPTWRIQRLFEDGELAEPARFGGKRAIPIAQIPAIAESLRKRGWVAARSKEDAHAS